MPRHGLAMLGSLLAAALGACGSGPTQQPKAKSMMAEFAVVPHAAGATRVLLSPNGQHALAELRGRWIHDEYGDHAADVPGLLKLLDNTGAIAKTMMGWPLGGPTDSGNFQYLTEGHEEGKLEVRSTVSSNAAVPLVPPGDGFWTMETTVAASSGPGAAKLRRHVAHAGQDRPRCGPSGRKSIHRLCRGSQESRGRR